MPRTPYEAGKKANRSANQGATSKRKSYRQRAIDAPVWDDCNPQLVFGIVCLCTTRNASPTLSYTRDGTSLVIAVYFEGERYVDYLAGPDELTDWTKWLVSDLLGYEDSDLGPFAFIASQKP
jgi:hypothetical protein